MNSGGKLSGEKGPSSSDPTLSTGTRVRVIGDHPTIAGSVRVEVIDGTSAGKTGVMLKSSLTKETLGKR